jgi:hypothetical protein
MSAIVYLLLALTVVSFGLILLDPLFLLAGVGFGVLCAIVTVLNAMGLTEIASHERKAQAIKKGWKPLVFKNGLHATMRQFGKDRNDQLLTSQELRQACYHNDPEIETLRDRYYLKIRMGGSTLKLLLTDSYDISITIENLQRGDFQTLMGAVVVVFYNDHLIPFSKDNWKTIQDALESKQSPYIYALLNSPSTMNLPSSGKA